MRNPSRAVILVSRDIKLLQPARQVNPTPPSPVNPSGS